MTDGQRYKHGWIKIGAQVQTPHGPAKVLSRPTPGSDKVRVKLDNPPGKTTGDAVKTLDASQVHAGTGAKVRAAYSQVGDSRTSVVNTALKDHKTAVGSDSPADHAQAAKSNQKAALLLEKTANQPAEEAAARKHASWAMYHTQAAKKTKGTNMSNEMDELTMELAVPLNLRAKARKAAAKKGQALPDGSFPIRNKVQLAKAKKAIGRANPSKRAKVQAFIAKRAKALGVANKGGKGAAFGGKKAAPFGKGGKK